MFLLFVITKEKKYLEEAQRIAGSVEKYFYRNNKLPDNYWFNVMLLRGYEELYKADKNKKQLHSFFDDAERIWKDEKDGTGLVTTKQAKTLSISLRRWKSRATGKTEIELIAALIRNFY